ncbi:glycosyltransferase family 2 protein [Mycetocola sp. 2940]|uniref:glycosyltransferase n=1 Tax=Mycetocola sp. 2940 TaxID=3156452 RepID=UPI00339B401E
MSTDTDQTRRATRQGSHGPAPNVHLDAEYVLPIRWSEHRPGDALELTDYLAGLANHLDVTVVDGSPDDIFATNHALWADLVRHVKLDGPGTPNGKVAGVMAGLRVARHQAVILADDDVRYDLPGLERMIAALQDADLVRPQNYFTALPWHARWDTARSLLNRAVASDYPGTIGVNRDLLLDLGGYAGDILFENLELIRTIRAAGGRERRLDDLFIGRVPPTAVHFGRQRVRQAYDDFAQPGRLAVELALLPMLGWSIRHPARLAGIAAVAMALAEWGRRRAGGTRVFPPTSALWAPAWLLERAVCVWLAVGSRMLGGAKYRNVRLRTAAHSTAVLRRKLQPMGLPSSRR